MSGSRQCVRAGARIDRHANRTSCLAGPLPVRLHARDGRFTTRPVSGTVPEMVTLPAPRVAHGVRHGA